MRLYICREVMQLFRIETEKFGLQEICLTPVWVEGEEPKVWAMSDAQNCTEALIELKSSVMSIWVPQRCLAELDEQVIVRGRRGFSIGKMTNSLRSQVAVFADRSI